MDLDFQRDQARRYPLSRRRSHSDLPTRDPPFLQAHLVNREYPVRLFHL